MPRRAGNLISRVGSDRGRRLESQQMLIAFRGLGDVAGLLPTQLQLLAAAVDFPLEMSVLLLVDEAAKNLWRTSNMS